MWYHAADSGRTVAVELAEMGMMGLLSDALPELFDSFLELEGNVVLTSAADH